MTKSLVFGVLVAKIQAVLFDIGETLLNFGRLGVFGLFRDGTCLAYDFLQKLGQPVGGLRVYMAI